MNDILKNNFNSDLPLFCGTNNNVSWKEYIHDVARFSKYFKNVKNDIVILYIPDDFYMFCVCFMALIQAGKNVALPAMLTQQNISGLDKLANIIVTNLNQCFENFQTINPSNIQDQDTDYDFHDINDRDIYFFTSGSTGTPKQIKKKMSMLLAEVDFHVKKHFDIVSKSPVLVASIAPYHMYGLLWRVLFPMIAGISVDKDILFTPEELQQKQAMYNNLLFITTPSFLETVSRYKSQYQFAQNCLRIFTSGSLLKGNIAATAYEMFGVSPFEVFGSTETGGIAYRQQNLDTNWTVFDDVIVSEQDGCLCVKSPYSFENPYLMSDAIEFVNDKQFKLLGRIDRIVKIAEERVSLPEMENKLDNHPYVARAYCATVKKGMRDVIGCMIELTDVGVDFVIKNGRSAFVKCIKQYLSGFFPMVVLPRTIRIVSKIPMNTQGKFIKNEIVARLKSCVVEPVLQNVSQIDDKFTADLTFLEDSPYFKGHFPDYPILPGVIQLHFVFQFIRQVFHIQGKSFDILKMKFSSLILPGILTHFELNRLSENEFSFIYSQKDKICSAGKIIIKENNNV